MFDDGLKRAGVAGAPALLVCGGASTDVRTQPPIPVASRRLFKAWQTDARASSPWLATARLLRLAARLAILSASGRGALRLVLEDPTFRLHVLRTVPIDPVFFLNHNAQLVRGLSLRARVEATLQHYENETRALHPGCRRAVYEQEGLPLWRHVHERSQFEIRLVGSDFVCEGGLSVAFYIDGERATVLSYSNIDPALVDDRAATATGPGQPLVPFISRHQASANRALRRVFADTFRRGTPGHFCLAALEGVALAQGSRELRAVPAKRQPATAWTGSKIRLDPMYDEQWRALSGERVSPLAWAIPLPLRHTLLAELPSDKRRRAVKLRRHMSAVRAAAYEAYRAQLRTPAPRMILPDP